MTFEITFAMNLLLQDFLYAKTKKSKVSGKGVTELYFASTSIIFDDSLEELLSKLMTHEKTKNTHKIKMSGDKYILLNFDKIHMVRDKGDKVDLFLNPNGSLLNIPKTECFLKIVKKIV